MDDQRLLVGFETIMQQMIKQLQDEYEIYFHDADIKPDGEVKMAFQLPVSIDGVSRYLEGSKK